MTCHHHQILLHNPLKIEDVEGRYFNLPLANEPLTFIETLIRATALATISLTPIRHVGLVTAYAAVVEVDGKVLRVITGVRLQEPLLKSSPSGNASLPMLSSRAGVGRVAPWPFPSSKQLLVSLPAVHSRYQSTS